MSGIIFRAGQPARPDVDPSAGAFLEAAPPCAYQCAAGWVAERLKAAVLKTAGEFALPRGFESHPIRQNARQATDFAKFF
jgi:hypothetical protein